MNSWNGAPELYGSNECARIALVRAELAFSTDLDLDEASRSLGLATYLAVLRFVPEAPDRILAMYGDEAWARTQRYLDKHPAGRPTEPLTIPRHRAGDKRKTPPEVRALWKIAAAGVDEVFLGLLERVKINLTLNLSWALHNSSYQKYIQYRETVDEMRRINRGRRISAGFGIIHPTLALLGVSRWIAVVPFALAA